MDSGSGMHHHELAMAPSSSNNGTMMHRKMMMHMTFYWGNKALVLFKGWPGSSVGMYVLALIFVFALALMVEWISHYRFIKKGASRLSVGLLQTLLHTVRVGLAFLVMLALMSFNGGVFLAAVAGHSVGFLLFGSQIFKNHSSASEGVLPPFSC